MEGELESMKTLHGVLPELFPAPLAIGTFKSDPQFHFFLCEFVNMTGKVPTNVNGFAHKLAVLHWIGNSPNGKYGFPIPTYGGRIKQATEWADTWEEYYTRNVKYVLQTEMESQGPDEEITKLSDALILKVIPRLLRPLETGGRSIKPCLIHGDLWDGNVSEHANTLQPCLYDPSCIYAHHEGKYDLNLPLSTN